MRDSPISHIVTEELLELMPLMGRIMVHRANVMAEEKTTVMQIKVLLLLIKHRLSVSDLARKRRVSLQSASTLVQGLVERGWVTRVPDPDDRRRSLLEVTPEGLSHAHLAKEQLSGYLTAILDNLEPAEITAGEVFLPALKRVLHDHIVTDGVPDDAELGIPE